MEPDASDYCDGHAAYAAQPEHNIHIFIDIYF